MTALPELHSPTPTDPFVAKFVANELGIEDLAAAVSRSEVRAPVVTPAGRLAYRPAVYLDNAASLPILRPVNAYARALEEQYRSNVGRSYGYQETVMRLAFSQARGEAARYFRAPKNALAVLGSNVTTLLLSLIKHIHAQHPEGHVILSPAGHSALSIPVHHLKRARWSHLELRDDYTYHLDALRASLERLQEHKKDVTIAIETVSNLSGYESNWRDVIGVAEEFGARVILDNAQGGCFVDIALDDYDCDVYVGISGHKLGARDGSAVLVGPAHIYAVPTPLDPTGGMIFNYTRDREFYLAAPNSLEAGTPNYVAQASLAAAMRVFHRVGRERIRASIGAITGYMASELQKIPGIEVLGAATERPRYGAVPFIARTPEGKEIPSMAIAACLAYFHGIQVRANHQCAPVLIQALKKIPNDDANELTELAQEWLGKPFEPSSHRLTQHLAAPAEPISVLHAVRASASFGTTKVMVDALTEALRRILAGREHELLEVRHNQHIGFSEYVPAVGDQSTLKTVLMPRVKFEDILNAFQARAP